MQTEMNVLGQSVLQDIRKIPAFENSIIAGGFVRDHLLEIKFTDIDIFVPTRNLTQFDLDLNSQIHSGNLGKDELFTGLVYKQFKKYSAYKPVHKYDCKYVGIDVDIMGIPYSGDMSKFTNFVTETFSYGIDMVGYDGEIYLDKRFVYDVDHQVATLLKLEQMNDLQGAMRKFERFAAKAPQYRFNSTCLEIKENKNKKEKSIDPSYAYYTTDNTKWKVVNIPDQVAVWNNPIIVAG